MMCIMHIEIRMSNNYFLVRIYITIWMVARLLAKCINIMGMLGLMVIQSDDWGF